MHAVALPPLPLCPGHPPQVVQTEPRRGEPPSPVSRAVSMEGAVGREVGAGSSGAQGPLAPLSASSLPADRARPALPGFPCAWCPSPASGSLSPAGRRALGAPLPGFSGPGLPSPGRERAAAACGCCSNEKSEQLNRKIWIKKLEFNTHAPHLLKH